MSMLRAEQNPLCLRFANNYRSDPMIPKDYSMVSCLLVTLTRIYTTSAHTLFAAVGSLVCSSFLNGIGGQLELD